MHKSFDKAIIENFGLHILFQVVTILVPIIVTPHLCRTILATGIGDYSYTYTIGTYFAMLCTLGMSVYGNRACACARDNEHELSRIFGEIYGVQLCCSAIAIFAYGLYVYFFAEQCRGYLWIQWFHVIGCALDVTWLFYGLEDFRKIVCRNVLVKICTTSLIFLLIRESGDTWIYVSIMASSVFLSQLLMWPFVLRKVAWICPTWKGVEQHILPLLKVSGPQICCCIYTGINRIMLTRQGDMSAVAYMSNSEGMSRLPIGIVTALSVVLMPRISNLYANEGGTKNGALLYKGAVATMALAIPCAFGLAAIAPHMVPWYYGESFYVCGEMIQYMAFVILIVAWGEVLQSQYLIPAHQDKILMRSALLGVVLSIIANVVLIKIMGIYGAGYAVLVTEGGMALYKTWHSRKVISLKYVIKDVRLLILGGVIMYVVVSALGALWGPTAWGTVKQIGVGIIVYMVCGILPYGIGHMPCWSDRRVKRNVSSGKSNNRHGESSS